jgi:hypothetical protein
MPDQKPPDALYVPAAIVPGSTPYVRAERLTKIARDLFGTPDGPPPVCSPHEDHDGVLMYFVRRSLADSKQFPTNHDRAGESRHAWTDGPNGVKLGHSKGD